MYFDVYTWFFYYGLKILKNKRYDIIDYFIGYFIKDFNFEDFIDCLVKSKYMTSYAKKIFLEEYKQDYNGLISFIKKNDCLNDEEAIDILVYLMCIYISFNLDKIDKCFKIYDIIEFFVDNLLEVLSQNMFIHNINIFFLKQITISDKKAFLEELINTKIIKLDKNKLNFYLYDYCLCVEDKYEDESLISSNNTVAMSIDKKERILDLVSLLDCLASDDFTKETIKELEKELFK